MNARRLLLRILTDYDRSPARFERCLDRELDASNLDNRDKGFVFEAACGIVRRQLTLDYAIDRLLDTPGLRRNAGLRRILRIGLYQLIFMDRVPDHAAVNESVNLAKSDPLLRDLAGVVNGVLRRSVSGRRLTAPPDSPEVPLAERLSIEHSHPVWMVGRWLESFGLAGTRQLLTFNNTPPETFLRRRMRDPGRQQFETEVHGLCDSAGGFMNLYYRLKKKVLPWNIRVVRQGWCAVQSPSSGWVVALLEAKRGDKVLDLCSSPGGKSALLSELIGADGSLCAADNRWGRIALTVDTLQRMRCENAHPLVCDGRRPPFDGAFDTVLLDAPCSATGVLHRHPEARWTKKPEDIGAMADLQRALLDSAGRLVCPGGALIYATCSLEREENHAQVQAFLRGHPEFEAAACPDCIPRTFLDAEGFLFITPFQHGMDGMFGARLVKKADG